MKGAKGSVAGSLSYTKVTTSLANLNFMQGAKGAATSQTSVTIDAQTGTAKLIFGTALKGVEKGDLDDATKGIKLANSVTFDADKIKLSGKAATNTKISGKQITVGNTTYVLIESTSAKDTSKDKASASAVAKAINDAKIKGSDGKSVVLKAFTSMDTLSSAIRRQFGSELKSVTAVYDDTSNTIVLKAETFADLNDAINFSLHVGADSSNDNKISVNISMMSARGLGVNGLNIGGDSENNATKAIDVVADALQKVSDQRAALGAVQNRLEHTINNLDNVVENTQAAESAIRDTDMASQMVTYSNNQILAQAGQAMLAQSNQANQGVLSLLG